MLSVDKNHEIFTILLHSVTKSNLESCSSAQMTVVVECSPANTGSVEALGTQIIQVVNWFPPTDHLVARQWNHLHILWCLSRLDLLGP